MPEFGSRVVARGDGVIHLTSALHVRWVPSFDFQHVLGILQDMHNYSYLQVGGQRLRMG